MMILNEQIEYRRFKPGQVKFSTSSLADPHVKKTLEVIAKHHNIPMSQLEAFIQQKVDQFTERAKKAPLLYGTMLTNLVEGEAFNLLWEKCPDLDVGAPKFKERTFFKLVRYIASEHRGLFWPLKSFIDKRRLVPKYDFVGAGGGAYKVDTAAATPSGTFIFNTVFCQKLMDYSYLKGVKPKGKKYVCNGGEIPDEYAYIEFLIMHEYMHYTNDDFYYHRIIPNSNPMINNWVGDFRSNYLLVKSGYEQIPIGLFNDSINYDRQQEYVEMYRLVEDEFNKLKPEDRKKAEDDMNSQSDDHQPGQEEAEKTEGTDGDPMKDGTPKPSEIDKKEKENEEAMQKSKDQSPKEREESDKEAEKDSDQPGDGKPGEKPGEGGKNSNAGEVDYSKIRPTFDWATLVRRFFSTVSKRTEETYAKPSRRGVGGLEMMRQTGAAPIKPAEIPVQTEAKLGFVFDCSASMSGVIGKVYANAVNLLKQPQFRNSECYVLKYANVYEMFRVNFARNAAIQVTDIKAKTRGYNKTAAQVFTERISGGTVFSKQMADEIIKSLGDRWNVLIFVDSDNIYPGNYENFISVIKAKPNQVFVIFDSRDTYIQFRQKFGGATPNITYFQ